MIKIIINDRIVIINPKHITHVELCSNDEIEIGIHSTHNLWIERSELPTVQVELIGSDLESVGWYSVIKALIKGD